MIVVSTKSFNRDISKIKNRKLATKVADEIAKLEAAKSLVGIQGLKKLTGTKDAYRFRLGDYRIGFFFINKTVKLYLPVISLMHS